jgi:hypothetical protein
MKAVPGLHWRALAAALPADVQTWFGRYPNTALAYKESVNISTKGNNIRLNGGLAVALFFQQDEKAAFAIRTVRQMRRFLIGQNRAQRCSQIPIAVLQECVHRRC